MKKKCGLPENELLDYFYGEIQDKVKIASITEHIFSCEECQEKIQAYTDIGVAMASVKVTFPNEIWAKHLQEVKTKLEKNKTFTEKMAEYFAVRKFKTAGVAFAVVMLLAFGVFFGRNIIKVANNSDEKEMIENLDIMENLDLLQFYNESSDNNSKR